MLILFLICFARPLITPSPWSTWMARSTHAPSLRPLTWSLVITRQMMNQIWILSNYSAHWSLLLACSSPTTGGRMNYATRGRSIPYNIPHTQHLFRDIKQYHVEEDVPIGVVILLGTHNPEEDSSVESNQTYHSQWYGQGRAGQCSVQ